MRNKEKEIMRQKESLLVWEVLPRQVASPYSL